MAIAFDAKGTAFSSSSQTLGGTGITVGSIANGILLAFLNQNAGDTTALQLDSSGGASFTQLSGGSVVQGGTRTSDIWYLLNPASGAHNLYITTAGARSVSAVLASFSGVSQSVPFGTRVTSTAQSPDGIVTTPSGSVVVDAYGQQFNDGSPTQDASQTLLFAFYGPSDGVQAMSCSYKARTGATTEMIWTGSGDGAYIAVPLLVAGASVTISPSIQQAAGAIGNLSVNTPRD